MPRNFPTRKDPQHRDHGAHRRRQDDDDRAHPLLHRPHPQDGRGPRGRCRHGLDGAGAGAGDHDHLGRDRLRVGGPSHQHHRHARATSTSPSRSSARCASSTARWRSSTPSRASSRSRRPSGARPTSTGSPASPTSTRWTASAPTSSAAVQTMRDRLGANPLPIQLPIGAEDGFEGVVDLIENKALVWTDELGTEFTYREIPAELAEAAHDARTHLIEACADYDDELMEAYLDRRGDPPRANRQVAAPRHARHQGDPGPLRLLVQEQGRPAASRRDRRAPPLAARGAADAGHRAAPQGKMAAAARPSAPPTRTRRSRPSPSRSWPTPTSGSSPTSASTRASSRAGGRVLNASTGRTERIGRLLMMHANHREEIEEAYAGDIVAGVGPEADRHRRHALRARRADRPRDDRVPRAGDRGRDRAEDQGRPGEALRQPRAARRGGPDVPGPDRTRRPARP